MAVPVLVGIARLTQRVSAPGEGLDAVDLMSEAVRAALDDASAPGLAKRVGLVGVPRGMWRCTDPARVIAERIGAPDARTISAEVGVLQHSLITGACERIASGEVDAAIVCGGEARYRHVLAAKAGVEGAEHPGPESPADEVWRPAEPVVTAFEFERGIVMAPTQYALISSAVAHANGWSYADRRRFMGELWASYAAVAAGDELAWDRSAPDASTIVTPSPTNRMVAFPYPRLLCSQWNVDQAAALVFASEDVARELGVPSDRRVYPVAAAESNAMVPLYTRVEVQRWPAFEHASRAVLDLAGCGIDDIGLLEIYSCFPSAVVVQLHALGIADRRPVSVTGGMTFGGGPLNNFVLQSTVAIAERLRAGDADAGLVTGVSGLLTKPGLHVWSSSPSPDGFRSADVSDLALRDTATRPVARPTADDERGPSTVVAATVSYDRGQPPCARAVLELDDGTRTVASSTNEADVDLVQQGDPVGARVNVLGPGRFAG
jgi:acetyl-CoA C-acetyltransferase